MRTTWMGLLLIAACGKGAARKHADDARAAKPAEAIDAAPAPPPDAAAQPRAEEVLEPALGPVLAFYLDRAETTVGEYAACVKADACPATGYVDEKHPEVAMSGVTFDEARAYCAWKGKRLPTVEEWKRAAVDLIGNVAEWTDPGPVRLGAACPETPSDQAHLMGSVESDQEQPRWFRNDDQGVRCARSMAEAAAPPAPDAIVGAILGGGWLIADEEDDAAAAIAAAAASCGAQKAATPIAGELLGRKGWLVVRGTAAAAGPDAIAAPKGPLVRVVGTAKCEGSFEDGPPRISVKRGEHAWSFDVPDGGAYQMWVEAGTWVTLEMKCPDYSCTGDCSAGHMGGEPTRFKTPANSSAGIEAPPMEISAGCTCD